MQRVGVGLDGPAGAVQERSEVLSPRGEHGARLRLAFGNGRIDFIPQAGGFCVARSEILPLVVLVKPPAEENPGGRYTSLSRAGPQIDAQAATTATRLNSAAFSRTSPATASRRCQLLSPNRRHFRPVATAPLTESVPRRSSTMNRGRP